MFKPSSLFGHSEQESTVGDVAGSKVSNDSGMSESPQPMQLSDSNHSVDNDRDRTLKRGMQITVVRGYSDDRVDVASSSSADTVTDETPAASRTSKMAGFEEGCM